ncbi:MAG: GAF domain-containing protein, partial [Thaumarchaeota archaeon]|nr:GAF domain-containing protein [Nitrososphaerota archaeon]
MNNGATPRTEQHLELLAVCTKIVSTSSLDQLLTIVVKDIPPLVDGLGCLIYLSPEFTPGYDGNLIDEKFQPIRAEEIRQEFIVIAAANRASAGKLVGKAFYTPGYGLTGWVFKHGKSLRIKNCSDPDELRAIAPDLYWADKYKYCKDYFHSSQKKPVLIVPLLARTRVIGVLTMTATMDEEPFSPYSETIANLLGQIVAIAIQQSWSIHEQASTITRLAQIGAKSQPKEVFEAVTGDLAEILNRRKCQLYLRDSVGSTVRLAFADGNEVTDGNPAFYERGQDLIGWVFKTGKPLLIDDVRKYASRRYLSDTLLDSVSDGALIDAEDRYLMCKGAPSVSDSDHLIPFLGVPVKASDETVEGVLCVDCLCDSYARYTTPFSRNDLQVAQSFAVNVSLTMAHERQRLLVALLTRLGNHSDPNLLFGLIVQEIPKLIFGTGCYIFISEQGGLESRLRLAKLSREGQVNSSESAPIIYRIGQGKTGFCALARATLVVNHYGAGDIARQAIDAEMGRIRGDSPDDLVAELYDVDNKPVGTIQLREGEKTPPTIRQKFTELSESMVVRPEKGLLSSKSDGYAALGSRFSWSFAAVPIKSEADDLYGVITIGRAFKQSPFSCDDITLLESIAGRLAAVLHNHRMQEQRQQLLMTLAPFI